ncbi:homocysteine S-methyltransferase family protein [Aquincola sp. S2]|uniref:Homocysteine S-methyltransferase family protein n=1 Tax=Pseudaquabacterium terrae TaxID=2732868 RepID=A0ABX2ECC0_9BURK|nr:homocysteine S-methyltransferase family protein [Aquabacterium terrae]NRF66074.1 homocysteine S-methyltransferase family protein [Aquabacterium terrae]
MATLVSDLPQLRGGLFLSDGGLETSLVYQRGIALPHFAAFVLLGDAPGRQTLAEYYKPYLALAARTAGAGFVLETPTWRANADWGAKLGFDAPALAAVNRDAAAFVRQLQKTWAPRLEGEIVTSGVIGPRGDGYIAEQPGSIDEAARYHRAQAEALREGGVDMLAAVTMTGSAEACGVARAAAAVGLPCAVSFTLETDGRLPSGESLGEAIQRVDADGHAPAYFQINCAHPSHFEAAVAQGGAWRERIHGLRANASTRSHAELDAATELDSGDPDDLAQRYLRLRAPLPKLNVLGGCCGTDERHLRAITRAWA